MIIKQNYRFKIFIKQFKHSKPKKKKYLIYLAIKI